MKDLETKNLKIRKFKMDDVEDVYKDEKSSQFPSVLDALSSHPATAERVKTVRDFEAKYQSNLQ